MTAAARALVVGIGSPDAGDDAVGLLVAEAVARFGLPDVEVLTHEDPTDLTLLWQGRSRAVVVDAVRSGAPAGTVVTVDALTQPLPGGRSSGTHDFGLASAIALSRALGTLPGRLTVVGVEGVAFAPGDPVSPAVAAAIGRAAAVVREILDKPSHDPAW
nr:hydrogenase maturation protease [Propionibacterium sp.]